MGVAPPASAPVPGVRTRECFDERGVLPAKSRRAARGRAGPRRRGSGGTTACRGAERRGSRCRRRRARVVVGVSITVSGQAAGPPGQELVGGLVDLVDVGTFLAIDLDVDVQLVHQPRGLLVLERFMRHHVAPVTGGVADRQQDRLVFAPRPTQRLRSPRLPIDRVVGMLPQVRTGFVRESVGVCGIGHGLGTRDGGREYSLTGSVATAAPHSVPGSEFIHRTEDLGYDPADAHAPEFRPRGRWRSDPSRSTGTADVPGRIRARMVARPGPGAGSMARMEPRRRRRRPCSGSPSGSWRAAGSGTCSSTSSNASSRSRGPCSWSGAAACRFMAG